jgi:hypothetical protein
MRVAADAIALHTERRRNHRCSVERADVGWFHEHLAEDLINAACDGSLIDKPQFLAQNPRGSAMWPSVAHVSIVRRLGDFAIIHPRPAM